MSEEDDLRAEIERLRAKIEAIDANKDRIRLQVSVKGALSLYGIRRFPVTFYADEWETIFEKSGEIRRFIRRAPHGAQAQGRVRVGVAGPARPPARGCRTPRRGSADSKTRASSVSSEAPCTGRIGTPSRTRSGRKKGGSYQGGVFAPPQHLVGAIPRRPAPLNAA